MSLKLLPFLRKFIRSIEKNANLDSAVIASLPLIPTEQEKIDTVAPNSVFIMHQQMNGLSLTWEQRENSDPDVRGAIKILSVEEILKDWEDIVFFDFTLEDDRMRSFHPIDFFVDECCVGAFLGKEDSSTVDDALYLYNFEGEAKNLYLNMEGYIQMMAAAKGFLYWQDSILEIIEDRENPTSQKFKEWMPQLFDGFTWNEYVELYNEVKLAT